MHKPLLRFLAIVLAAGSFAASAAALKVGDPAPKLQLDKWLKGEPIKEFEKGKIYVIDCWATRNGLSVAAMPHVTKMQAKYKNKGVIVIGVNVWEDDPAAAEPFVKKMGDKMGYSVATDLLPIAADGSNDPGIMATTWLGAAGRTGIPCSFIVDRQGKIAWIGHPIQMEHPLSLLADNKFDPAAEARFDEKINELNRAVSMALNANDNDKALAALDQIAALNPFIAPHFRTTRLSVLIKKEDYTAANALAAKLAGEPDAAVTQLAAILLNAGDTDKIDTNLALKLATKAYEENGKAGWQYQNLLAKAYAAHKEFEKAVALQTRVVAQVPRQFKDREQKSLDEFRQKAAETK